MHAVTYHDSILISIVLLQYHPEVHHQSIQPNCSSRTSSTFNLSSNFYHCSALIHHLHPSALLGSPSSISSTSSSPTSPFPASISSLFTWSSISSLWYPPHHFWPFFSQMEELRGRWRRGKIWNGRRNGRRGEGRLLDNTGDTWTIIDTRTMIEIP